MNRHEVLMAILDMVCRELGQDPEEVKKGSRYPDKVEARHIYFYLARQHSNGYNTKELGRSLGKDHATVIAATKKINGLMQVEAGYREKMNRFLVMFSNEFGINKPMPKVEPIVTQRAALLIAKNEELTKEVEELRVQNDYKSEQLKEYMHRLNAVEAQNAILESQNKLLKDLQKQN
nr:helix-turn-helix domain-containing protein [uncultured Flavobacterium sp.]